MCTGARRSEEQSQNSVEHVERPDESVLPRTPLAQLLERNKAVLVAVDFLNYYLKKKNNNNTIIIRPEGRHQPNKMKAINLRKKYERQSTLLGE